MSTPGRQGIMQNISWLGTSWPTLYYVHRQCIALLEQMQQCKQTVSQMSNNISSGQHCHHCFISMRHKAGAQKQKWGQQHTHLFCPFFSPRRKQGEEFTGLEDVDAAVFDAFNGLLPSKIWSNVCELSCGLKLDDDSFLDKC